ncbi:hypothetical protein ACOJVU_11765 [Mycobacterium sp. THU-M104]|uniref:hypothetical protein n=1 Tax=Mycobacterium sp. THU-M104 TaxID=3410515 RepID=UPI003B9CB9C7
MTDQSTTAALHQAVAAFVAEHLADDPDDGGFTGGFAYRIDLHRADGTVVPFIYTSDDAHTELWRVRRD